MEKISRKDGEAGQAPVILSAYIVNRQVCWRSLFLVTRRKMATFQDEWSMDVGFHGGPRKRLGLSKNSALQMIIYMIAKLSINISYESST